MTYIITPDMLDMSNAKPCISCAQKFIIPIPAYADGGEPLVYPAGENKGQPIIDWQGKTIGDRGLVFNNDKDGVVQAALGNGQAIVIINQVGREQAAALALRIESLGGDPSSFTIEQTKEVLAHAREIGLGDQYNSDRSFMRSKLTPVSDLGGYGLFKRDDRDLCQAVIMGFSGLFLGPAGEPQPFVPGDAIVAQPDGSGGASFRKVDGHVFSQTYTAENGAAFDMASAIVPDPGNSLLDGLAQIRSRKAPAETATPSGPKQTP